MPIEIKELHVKITVDTTTNTPSSQFLDASKIKDFKADVVRSCTKEILEILKEKQER